MNLQELEFHQIDMSQIVFQSFASALNKCAGDGYNNLTHISLCDIYCSDEGAAAIFEVLKGWGNLQYLCFSENEEVGVKGCTALSNLLTNPATTQLSGLIFSHNDLDDECMAILGNALKINSTVEIIELSGNENASAFGWHSCFSNMFHGPTCSIRRLTLLESELTDAAVSFLFHSLVGNKTLELLDLYGNESITSVGWQEMANRLSGPDAPVVEHINLGECNIDDASAHMIVAALAFNTSLKELVIYQRGYEDITPSLWDELYWVLCDETSIDSTYSSNHTFGRIWTRPRGYSDCDMPEYIFPLLRMNRIEDKSHVARLKILKFHFYEGGDDSDTAYQIGVFAQMPEIMMPFALEWIGREIFAGLHILENRNHAFSLMYRVVRGIPTLFDIGRVQQQRAGGTKRRRQD